MKNQNNRSRGRAPRISLIAASLIAMSTPLAAQEEQIEQIIVKGEKIDRSIQDTASSVAVFTSSEIEESAIYDIQDVFDRLANVSSSNANEGFTIRGISDRQVGAAGTSSLASLHIDGAFISRSGILGGQKDLWDISQIEVFRGPQSTNQGRNSLAGAIFVRSNDPTYEPDAQYRVTFGTDNTRAISLAYGDAIIEDQLAFRLSVDNQETDGFINNQLLNDDEFGDSSNTTVRGKLLFEPASIEGLSILTTLSYSDNEAGSILSSTIDADGNEISPFDNLSFANIDTINDIEQIIATTEINYQINDQWSFTSISSYNEDERIRQDDDDAQATGGLASNNRFETNETFSQEFRFNFESEKLKANVGAYYFNNDNEEDLDDFLAADQVQDGITGSDGIAIATFALNNPESGILPLIAGAGLGALGFPNSATADQVQAITNSASQLFDNPFLISNFGDNDVSIENYAVFANIEYDISDFVTVFGGFRYDNEEVTNRGTLTQVVSSPLGDPAVDGTALADSIVSSLGVAPFFAASPLVEPSFDALGVGIINSINGSITDSLNDGPLDSSSTFSAFLPKVGVTLNWADNLSTSFSVQRAYRAGGAGITSGGEFDFDPEFTTNYDLSLRSQWFDNRLTLNANLFYVDWEDQQVIVPDPSAVSAQELFTANAGESSLFGFELEAGYIVNSSLDFYTNIGYVETEFEDFNISLENNEELDLSGNEFNNAPELTAAAGFSYDVTTSLRLQADINYQAESFDDPENEFENDARTLVNSKVTYSFNENFEVAVVARNLFDREYIVQSDEFERDTVVVGQPRTVLVQLQGKF